MMLCTGAGSDSMTAGKRGIDLQILGYLVIYFVTRGAMCDVLISVLSLTVGSNDQNHCVNK